MPITVRLLSTREVRFVNMDPAAEVTIAIVEDSRRTREGLAALIAGTHGLRLCGEFRSMEEALSGLGATGPDVVLTDIGLPGMSGIDGVRLLRDRWPRLHVVILTVHGDDDHVFAAICAGACGYLLKDTPPHKLLEAIVQANDGGAPMSPDIARKVLTMFQRFAPPRGVEHDLTERELDVLHKLSDGLGYKQIGAQLQMSLDTVRFHLRNIYAKLHVHSKSEAVMAALRRGIVR
ncbi:MAG TPA: response regulator transcription factor [Planctomycetota bacterium]|nr:response regulator transcription factor [Planctomycetota bacterium]